MVLIFQSSSTEAFVMLIICLMSRGRLLKDIPKWKYDLLPQLDEELSAVSAKTILTYNTLFLLHEW